MTMGVSSPAAEGVDEVVHLYVKAGVDGERLGACPFCQRIQMVVLKKHLAGLFNYELIPCNPSKPPDELKRLGLKHLPAIIHGDEGFDAVDDIVEYMDERFPGGGLDYECPEADIACKDFFSQFCFFVKSLNKDCSKLDRALERLNAYIESTTPPSSLATNSPPPTSPTSPLPSQHPLSPASTISTPQTASPVPSPGGSTPSSPLFPKLVSPSSPHLLSNPTNWPMVSSSSKVLSSRMVSVTEDNLEEFLVGPSLSHLDCEVLPKLQQLRVAANALKQYSVPRRLMGVWRYLHTAYSNPIFVQTCPCDQEIILHWHDRVESKKMSHKKHAEISKEKPQFSLDVPAFASIVTVVEMP